jgi:hypothetical protein
MSLGIVTMVITGDSQQSRTYGVELPGIDFGWKVVLLVAKPVPGFCYCIGNHKTTIPQPIPGCKHNDLKSTD